MSEFIRGNFYTFGFWSHKFQRFFWNWCSVNKFWNGIIQHYLLNKLKFFLKIFEVRLGFQFSNNFKEINFRKNVIKATFYIINNFQQLKSKFIKILIHKKLKKIFFNKFSHILHFLIPSLLRRRSIESQGIEGWLCLCL